MIEIGQKISYSRELWYGISCAKYHDFPTTTLHVKWFENESAAKGYSQNYGKLSISSDSEIYITEIDG